MFLRSDKKVNTCEHLYFLFYFFSSYGGMLSGYMRYKYPHIITAAVASSAPFYTIAGNRPRNEFFQAVTNVSMYFIRNLYKLKRAETS